MQRFWISSMDQHINTCKSWPQMFPSGILLIRSMYANASVTVASGVRVQGQLVPSRGMQDVELLAKQVTVLGESPEAPDVRSASSFNFLHFKAFPLQFTGAPHYAEHYRAHQHLRPRARHMGSVLRLRSLLVSTMHKFFDSQGFTYTNPPVVTSSDAEGAGESFNVIATQEDFFGLGGIKLPKLTVSTQLHLEALMMGMGRVWTLSPTFRAEKSVTSRHLAEFWMLEAEWVADDLDQLVNFVERMLRHLVTEGRKSGIVEELEKTMDKQDNVYPVDILAPRWEEIATTTFARLTYTEAIRILQAEHSQRPFNIPPVEGAPLQAQHEQYLAMTLEKPIFITHYPRQIKPFYMLTSPDGTNDLPHVENFDLVVPGIGEIAGGSLRIHDLRELELSMRADNVDEGELEWYKDLRKWGSVPHGGFGLGFDRLIAYLAGIRNLKEVVAFPRMFGRSGCVN
jgi:asparaginyl-tRNA synthetase